MYIPPLPPSSPPSPEEFVKVFEPFVEQWNDDDDEEEPKKLTTIEKDDVSLKSILDEVKNLQKELASTSESIGAQLATTSERLQRLEEQASKSLVDDTHGAAYKHFSAEHLQLGRLESQAIAIRTRMDSLQADIAESDKMRRIEWALANSKSYDLPSGSCWINGVLSPIQPFVVETLFCFRKNQGRYFPLDAYHRETRAAGFDQFESQEEKEAGRESFRYNIADHLHSLLGVKPRVEQDEENGHYVIYYS